MQYPLHYAVGHEFQKGKKNQCGELIALSYLVYYFFFFKQDFALCLPAVHAQ